MGNTAPLREPALWKPIGMVVGAVLVGLIAYVMAYWPLWPRSAGSLSTASAEVPSVQATKMSSLKQSTMEAELAGALEVLVFSASDCPECLVVREQVIPQLRATFGSAIRIRVYDLADGSSYASLVEQEKRVGSQEAVTAKLFVGGRYLAGADQIAGKAVQVVKEALAERFREGA